MYLVGILKGFCKKIEQNIIKSREKYLLNVLESAFGGYFFLFFQVLIPTKYRENKNW